MSGKRVAILNIPIEVMTRAECVTTVIDSLNQGVGGWICTVNLDIARQLHEIPEVRQTMSGVTHFVADGWPIVLAARFQGVRLPERVCGSDLVYDLPEAAAKAGKSVFFLGGNPGTAEKSSKILQEKFPGLKVVGHCCPELGFEKRPEAIEAIREQLRRTSADIVFVALGVPKSERLIAVIKDAAPTAWFIGVGISFSFISGEVHRAPKWMQSAGLEWFHRMSQEPSRLWKRYLLHDVPFLFTLFRSTLQRRPGKERSLSGSANS